MVAEPEEIKENMPLNRLSQQPRNRSKGILRSISIEPAVARPSHEPPPQFICPLSLEMMEEPVFISSGHSFEKSEIEKWLAACDAAGEPARDPLTNLALESSVLVPNVALRQMIAAWRVRAKPTGAQGQALAGAAVCA